MSKENEVLKEHEIKNYMKKTNLTRAKIQDTHEKFQKHSKEGLIDYDSFRQIIQSYFTKSNDSEEFYQLVFNSN
jgi:Ca2+-binding EF-hand superfamily protein